MLKIGVTGGIGAGKGIVCKVFENLGIPVFNADIEARNLLLTPEVQLFYKENFGNEVFTQGQPDRAKIAAIAFKNKDALNKINSFIHPLVYKAFNDWGMQYQHLPYIVKEAALLIESGSHTNLNRIILVSAPTEIRINRVMRRDGLNREQIVARIQNQWTDEKKSPYAHYTIINDGIQPIVNEIINLHKKFLTTK